MVVDYENAYGWNPENDNYKQGNKSIASIFLTGGGYVNYELKGIHPDSQFGWQDLVWKKTPTRDAKKFGFTNIDNIDVGLVAMCEIKVAYLNYEDFKILRNILARERHFTVRFFDVDEGEWITRDMYCTENSKDKLFTLNQSLLGAMGVTIKLVATNIDVDITTHTVKYNLNGGTGTTPSSTTVNRGDQLELDSGESLVASTGKHLAYWVTKSGNTITGYYVPSQSISVWKDLDLYAYWE